MARIEAEAPREKEKKNDVMVLEIRKENWFVYWKIP
jgi:hypothetical protein